MYKTSIKDRYKDSFKGFWWNDSGTEDFLVVMTMGNMSLLYCEETGLLLDIYNNKIEKFQTVELPCIIVEAKNVEYADRFDLHGRFQIVGHTGEDPVLLKVCGIEDNKEHLMLPSRLRVVEIT